MTLFRNIAIRHIDRIPSRYKSRQNATNPDLWQNCVHLTVLRRLSTTSIHPTRNQTTLGPKRLSYAQSLVETALLVDHQVDKRRHILQQTHLASSRAYELCRMLRRPELRWSRHKSDLIPCRESGRHRGSSPPTQTALPAAHIRETCSLLAPLLQDCRQQAAAAGDRANRLEVEPMAAMHRPIEALTRMSALEGLCRCCPRLSV
jgi:hypothetical protein